MSRGWYAICFYILPVLVILTAELVAVFSNMHSRPTITSLLTDMPETLLLALTAFAAVWTWEHWRATYRSRQARKKS